MSLLLVLIWWALFVAFCCGAELDRTAIGMVLFTVAVKQLVEYLRERNAE